MKLNFTKIIALSALLVLVNYCYAQSVALAKINNISSLCTQSTDKADVDILENTPALKIQLAYLNAIKEGKKNVKFKFGTSFGSNMLANYPVPSVEADTLTSTVVVAKDPELANAQVLNIRIDENSKIFINDVETDYPLISEEVNVIRTAFKGIPIVLFSNIEVTAPAKEYFELRNTLYNIRDNISYEIAYAPYKELNEKEKQEVDKVLSIGHKEYFYDKNTVIDDCGCMKKGH